MRGSLTIRPRLGRGGRPLTAVLLAVLLCACTGSARPAADPTPPAPPSGTATEPPPSPAPVDPPERIDLAFLDVVTGFATPVPAWLARIEGARSFAASPDATRLAFVAPDRAGVDQVFIAHLGTTSIRQVTRSTSPAIATPTWSPDGTRVAYVVLGDIPSRRYLAPGRLVALTLSTGRSSVIFRDRDGVAQPSFAPDGDTIMFTRPTETPRGAWRTDLWTVPASGGRPSLLIRHGANGAHSPDGSLIAYQRTAPMADAFCIVCWWIRGDEVTFVAADGSEQPGAAEGGLIADPGEYGSTLRWSPDGTRVASNFLERSVADPIVVVDAATGRSYPLGEGARPSWVDERTLIVETYRGTTTSANEAPSTPTPVPADAFVDLRTGIATPLPLAIRTLLPEGGYAVSPDGRRLAFVGSRDGGRAVFLASIAGDHIRRLTRAPAAPRGMPSWSPDGRSVVFEGIADDRPTIFLVRVRGVPVVRRLVPFARGRRFDVVSQPTFAPNGRSILFTAAHDGAPRGGRWMGLWTVPIGGGRPSLLVRDAGYGSFAPGGSAVAFHPVRPEVEPSWWAWPHRIVVAYLDGRPRHEVKRSAGTLMAPLTYDHTLLLWSPDGTRLVCTCSPMGSRGPVGVWDVDSGRVRFVGTGGSPTWLDDHTLIVGAYRPRS